MIASEHILKKRESNAGTTELHRAIKSKNNTKTTALEQSVKKNNWGI